MGIKDELLADQAEQQEKATRSRCATCRALDAIDADELAEYEKEIMPDKSFQDAAISRWLTKRTAITVSKESVAKHRKAHL